MRILHVLTNLELAGAQTSVASICRGLHAHGFEVHVAYSSRGGRTPQSDRSLVNMLERARVPVHDLPAMRRGIGLRDGAALLACISLMRRVRPDIVHTHMSKAGVIGRLAARIIGVPVVVHTVRGWSFYAAPRGLDRVAAACERAIASRTSAMVAVSRSLIADGVAAGIGTTGSYRLIRSGIELSRFRNIDRASARERLGIARDARVVGGVMALADAKAPFDFVRVARRVVDERRDVIFAIAGYGPLQPAIERALDDAGLASHVRLLGLREDVELVYGAIDVLLVTSRWEGLPRVAVEAIAAGVPVVASNVGGSAEVVVDGRTGFLAPAGDIAGLTRGVLGALDGSLEPALDLDEFELGGVISQHVALYDELRPRCVS